MKDAGSRKGRRALATETRQELLMDAAITCFTEKGIGRTSMRDIAAQAGVSIGNLYNHFPGRNDLIAEIARKETAGLSEIIEKVDVCTDRSSAVETFVKAYFNYCAVPVYAVLTIEITAEALRNPAIGKLFNGNRSLMVGCLADAIVLDEPENARAHSKQHREIAGLAIDTIEGSALRVGLSGKKPNHQVRNQVLRFVKNALPGGVK